jgi:hypothetical protein
MEARLFVPGTVVRAEDSITIDERFCRGTAGLNSLDLDSVGPNLLFVRLNMLGSQAETFCSFSLSVGKQ